jgi:hypothetical protein
MEMMMKDPFSFPLPGFPILSFGGPRIISWLRSEEGERVQSGEARARILRSFEGAQESTKGTVQRELRWVKIGINRTVRINCIAGKCHLPCPKGHHHERSINVLDGCNTF